MLSFIEIPVGSGDTVSCRLCSTVSAVDYFPTASILDVISEAVTDWVHGPGPNIVLTGPEPYLHPGIPDLVTGAVERGVERLSLRTDASALADAANASGSVAAGVRHVEVVLLGGCAATHDRLAGKEGGFDAAISGMSMFKDAAARQNASAVVCARIPVCGHNVKDLPGTVLALAGVGASSVVLDIDPALPLPVVRPWVDAAVETGIVNGLWVSVRGRSATDLRIDRLHEVDPMVTIVSKGGTDVE